MSFSQDHTRQILMLIRSLLELDNPPQIIMAEGVDKMLDILDSMTPDTNMINGIAFLQTFIAHAESLSPWYSDTLSCMLHKLMRKMRHQDYNRAEIGLEVWRQTQWRHPQEKVPKIMNSVKDQV